MPLSSEETIILQNILIEDEKLKPLPYFDCCGKFFRKCTCKEQGKLTIGVGRNIEDIGLSENESLGLLANDMKRVTALVERYFQWFPKLNVPRRIVILSMTFNMGIQGIQGFQKMIRCIGSGDFESAANQMLNSRWAAQVGKRAVRLSDMMRTGIF